MRIELTTYSLEVDASVVSDAARGARLKYLIAECSGYRYFPWAFGGEAEENRPQDFEYGVPKKYLENRKSLKCGRSSVVERQLPKLYVVSSILIARSIHDAFTGARDLRSPCPCRRRTSRPRRGRRP